MFMNIIITVHCTKRTTRETNIYIQQA